MGQSTSRPCSESVCGDLRIRHVGAKRADFGSCAAGGERPFAAALFRLRRVASPPRPRHQPETLHGDCQRPPLRARTRPINALVLPLARDEAGINTSVEPVVVETLQWIALPESLHVPCNALWNPEELNSRDSNPIPQTWVWLPFLWRPNRSTMTWRTKIAPIIPFPPVPSNSELAVHTGLRRP